MAGCGLGIAGGEVAAGVWVAAREFGWLRGHLGGCAGVWVAARTLGEGTFSRPLFRFRKAGSSKLSAPGCLVPHGPAHDTPSMAGVRLFGTSLSQNPGFLAEN